MDPNDTLRKIRELANDILMNIAVYEHEDIHGSLQWFGDIGKLDDKATQLAESVAVLDSWLQKGGFYPADWSRKEGTDYDT